MSWPKKFSRGPVLKAAAAGAIALLLVGAYHGGRSFYRYATNLRMFAAHPSTLDYLDFPSWVSPRMAGEIRGSHGMKEPFSVFDAERLRQIHENYGRNPWVRKVGWVRRRFPNRVEVALELRRPVAYVETTYAEEIHLVDEEGVRLNAAAYPPGENSLRLPVIQGIRRAPPQTGEAWRDAAIRNGLELVRLVHNDPDCKRWQIVKYDLSRVGRENRAGESEVELLTKPGARILWGKAPFSPGAPDLAVAQKMDFLRYSTVADLGRLAYVSIRTDPPTISLLQDGP